MVSKNGIIIIRTNRKTFAGKILESIIVFISLFNHHGWVTSSNKNKRYVIILSVINISNTTWSYLCQWWRQPINTGFTWDKNKYLKMSIVISLVITESALQAFNLTNDQCVITQIDQLHILFLYLVPMKYRFRGFESMEYWNNRSKTHWKN